MAMGYYRVRRTGRASVCRIHSISNRSSRTGKFSDDSQRCTGHIAEATKQTTALLCLVIPIESGGRIVVPTKSVPYGFCWAMC